MQDLNPTQKPLVVIMILATMTAQKKKSALTAL